VGFVVKEFSPYETDLDWSALSRGRRDVECFEQLGRATAKGALRVDADDESTPAGRLPDRGLRSRRGAGAARTSWWRRRRSPSAWSDGARARRDHALFVDAFRSGPNRKRRTAPSA
jgi:hypothetical protein